MSQKIKYLFDTQNDASLITPRQLIEYLSTEEETQELMETHKQAMVLFLNNANGEYDVQFYNAGMSCSQMLALLEIAKQNVISNMGY